MTSLSKMQARAREEFVKRFEEQEFTNHLGYPEQSLFLLHLDSLIASTREETLNEVEAGMEKTRLLEVGVSPESVHRKLHYNQVLDKLLAHLASLRKQGEGKE